MLQQYFPTTKNIKNIKNAKNIKNTKSTNNTKSTKGLKDRAFDSILHVLRDLRGLFQAHQLSFIWRNLLPFSLVILFFLSFLSQTNAFAKEVAPHKIYGHLILGEEIVNDLQDYLIQVRLEQDGTDYIVASYQADPSYDDYYVVEIPLDDRLKEGVASPGDRVDLLINGFLMARDIELSLGKITKMDIRLCTYTELKIIIEGVEEGADYLEDVIPVIRTWGCGVHVHATLNGEEYNPGDVITESNHYTLLVRAEDASGRNKEAWVNFTKSTAMAEGLNGGFTDGLSGWSIEGASSLVSSSDAVRMGTEGYAAMFDPPGPSEYVMIKTDPIYTLAGAVYDLSFYLHGKAKDEALLQITSFQDTAKQDPVPLIQNERIFLTADDIWQKISTQLIIPEGQYFIQIAIGRDGQAISAAPLAVDNISLEPISYIATPIFYMGNWWVMLEDGTRNLLSGQDEDLGIFEDDTLGTLCNPPGTTCGKKALLLSEAQILRNVYLMPGDYIFSLEAWAQQPRTFAVEIGMDEYTLSTGPSLIRYVIPHTQVDEGWCPISFNNPNQVDIHVTRIQLEQRGYVSSSYTPAGRSDGYLRIAFSEGERIDFSQRGMFSFIFRPRRQDEDLFLAGAEGWDIIYRDSDKDIVFSMADMPDLCTVDLSPDGLLPTKLYQVTLSWDGEGALLAVEDPVTSDHIGSDETAAYNNSISSEAFLIGSYLIGINQSRPSNGNFGKIRFETNRGLSCIRFDTTCMVEYLGTYTINHVPSAPSLEAPADMGEVTTSTPLLTIQNSDDPEGDPVAYEFEIYSDANLASPPIARSELVPEGYGGVTSWQCSTPLHGNTWYYWRVRAFDGLLYTEWTEEAASFHITTTDSSFEFPLLAGWSMISLPVDPNNTSLLPLFSGSVVVYGYERGSGYIRAKNPKALKVGKGYWILLNNAQRFTLLGKAIDEYTLPVKNGWYMIGGCTLPAKASVDKGNIVVIYEYMQEAGYYRVVESETLSSGKGYWILFKEITDQANLRVIGVSGE